MAYWQTSVPRQSPKTKTELREMLAEAVRNTQSSSEPEPLRPSKVKPIAATARAAQVDWVEPFADTAIEFAARLGPGYGRFLCDQRENWTRGQRMRKIPMPTEQEIVEGPQRVSFQIANGNARQLCILQTTFATKVEAQRYFLTNWLTIEKMARAALATGTIEDGQIKLAMS
jgi:hypothetical protein